MQVTGADVSNVLKGPAYLIVSHMESAVVVVTQKRIIFMIQAVSVGLYDPTAEHREWCAKSVADAFPTRNQVAVFHDGSIRPNIEVERCTAGTSRGGRVGHRTEALCCGHGRQMMPDDIRVNRRNRPQVFQRTQVTWFEPAIAKSPSIERRLIVCQ